MSDYISTHWGTYKVYQDKDNKIKLDSWELDARPTKFGLGLADASIDELRIQQPCVRRGWLEKKDKNDCKRGKDEFIAVSWDEAFNLASTELLLSLIHI